MKALKAKEVLMDAIEGIVRKRMELEEQPEDILASLIAARDEEGKPLDVETITHEVQVQLFAGHDTTVTALTNLLLMLTSQPEVVAKAREEAEGLPTELTLEDIKGLSYIPMVIYESMRLQPPIQSGFRVAMEDIAYQGYRIPKDWTVVVNIFSAHQQDSWTQPLEFDPERMNPHRAEQKTEQGKFIPFGGGPRICLGQHFAMVEMNLVLAMFLRRFNFSLQPGQNLKMNYLPFPLPKSGVVLKIEARR
ncbi:MAG: cytochrome P450 [Bacteroidota bacterium]